jgi:enterochelin esterase-like enzyme
MDLIERYLDAVTAKLRPKRRGDVARELRAAILDALEARDASPESEADVVAVLAELGEPSSVADGYEPGRQYLIGPELYPLFRRVVRAALATLVSAIAVGFGVSLLLGGLADARAGEFLLDSLEFAVRAAIVAVVLIVAVFAWLQRSEVRVSARGHLPEGWDPRSLPAVTGPDRASRFDSVIGLVATAIAMVILGGIGQAAEEALPSVADGMRPIIRHAVLDSVIVLQGAAALSALAHAVALIEERWRPWTRAMRLGADALAVFVFVRVPVELVVHRSALLDTGLSPNTVWWLVLTSIVIGAIGVAVVTGMSIRAWRGRRELRVAGRHSAPALVALAILLAGSPVAARAEQAPAMLETAASPIPAMPTGEMRRFEYASESFGETRGIVVYLPPGYDGSGTRTYPVLYLLHGVMEDETAWSAKGRVGALLDELIGSGEIEPVIAVMPLGYGFPDAATRAQEMLSPMTDQLAVAEAFSAALLDEVLPLIDREFRTRADAGSRAIVGLSMGGSQALYVGLNHSDTFDRVVSLSGALIMYGGRYAEWFPALGAPETRLPGLIDLSVGSEDFLLGVNRHFAAWLAERGLDVELHEVPGSHEWDVYRRELARVAPLLFPEGTY